MSASLGARWVAAAHRHPMTHQRVLGHYVLWNDQYYWVLHDEEAHQVLDMPVNELEARWDAGRP